jgi:protein TonB
MLSETTSMRTLQSVDNPWRRLPWTLPAALLVWAAVLWGFAHFMEKPTLPVEPPPIEARLIEEPAPVATRSNLPERPVVVHEPKPLPQVMPRQAPVMPQVSSPTEQRPQVQKAEAPTNSGPSVLAAAPGGVSGEGQAAAYGNTSGYSGSQAGSYDGNTPSRGNIYANSGARAIVRPMPQIPDDLRAESFNVSALARFHIAVDGSAKVELAKPTPNTRLNWILLDSLKKWRFIPAIKNGKPVASTEEIVVRIEVK